MKHHLRTALLFVLTATSHSQTMADIHNLLNEIKSGYDKQVRPIDNQQEPVTVTVYFDLVAIQGLDEVTEKLSAVGLLSQEWIDPRMTWTPHLYNYTSYVHIPTGDVWKPDFVVANSVDEITVIGRDWMKIWYTYQGIAFWSPGDVYYCTCTVDLTYYPFDIQACKLEFMEWGYTDKELKIAIRDSDAEVRQKYFNENGEWDLIRSSVDSTLDHDDEYYATVTVRLWIKRRPLFLLVNVLLPIMLLAGLNVLVFAIPVESGERVSFAITVLLAITVFLTIVGNNMPKRSHPMAVLCYFLFMNLIVSALICCGTIYNLTIYHRDNGIPVPELMARVTRKLLCWHAKKTSEVQIVATELHECNGKQIYNVDTSSVDRTAVKNETIQQPNEEKTDDVPTVTWQHVSRMFDRIFGTVAIIWLLATSIGFLAMASKLNTA